MRMLGTLLCAAVCAVPALAAGQPQAAPDLILMNGRIYTVDAARPWAEALAATGDRIIATGTTAEIRALAGATTRVIDLGSRNGKRPRQKRRGVSTGSRADRTWFLRMVRFFTLLATHAIMLVAGFALGVYMLPILTAPKGPDVAALQAMERGALQGPLPTRPQRQRRGALGRRRGEGAARQDRSRGPPGARARLQAVSRPSFVDTKEGFLGLKDKSRRVGDVKTFDGFLVDVPAGVESGPTAPSSCGARPSASSSPPPGIASSPTFKHDQFFW